MTHKPLCSVPGCPAPCEPEYSEWHKCWAKAIPGHKCFGELHHQHWPKKGMGGHNPKSKIVACLCAGMHDAIDNGFKYGNAVLDDPRKGKVYTIWRMKDKKALLERVIEPTSVTTSTPGHPVHVEIEESDEVPTFHSSRVGVPESPETPPGPRETALSPYQDRHLRLDKPLSYEEYCSLAATLMAMEGNLNFWLGDAIVLGEEWFGERCYQPWVAKGHKKEKLKQCAWVASRFSVTERNPNLTFTHHRLVAAREDRFELLERAEKEDLRTGELQALISDKAPDVCPETGGPHEWVCKHCGKAKGAPMG